MSNYVTMVNRIANDIVRSDLGTEIREAIQAAIDHYAGTRFWFNEQRASANTVDGQEFYPLPSDLVEVDNMTTTVQGHTYPLQVRTMAEIDDIRRSTTESGYPEAFALFQERFRIYPVPDGTYTLTLAYQRTLPALVNDLDTNAWMTSAEVMIRCRAKRDVYAHVLMDQAKAEAQHALELEAFAELIRKTERRLTSGRLQPTMF